LEELSLERIGSLGLWISREHRFGTDAFLLADFARVRQGERACDLCSGCGILPVLWFREEPFPQAAWGVELMEEPFRLMERTLGENPSLSGRFFPLLRDLRDLTGVLPAGTMDLVTCNPPYTPPGRGIPPHTPGRLTARHQGECPLPELARSAARLLRFGGRFCLCGRPQYLPDAMEALRGAGLEPKRLRLVQKLADTPPWLFLLEGRRGGKPFLQVEAPLLMESPQGGFTPEVLKIYGKEIPL
jgi:tRNA1Val (adenine37-N6)-methyltransferase